MVLKKNKILVIDDDETILELLYDMFQEEGYDVVKAPNASLASMRAIDADLVILDLKLSESPTGQGQDVLKHLWGDKWYDIPVIVFSGYIDSQVSVSFLKEIETAIGAGRNIYKCVSKSDGLENLLEIVNGFFDQHKINAK